LKEGASILVSPYLDSLNSMRSARCLLQTIINLTITAMAAINTIIKTIRTTVTPVLLPPKRGGAGGVPAIYGIVMSKTLPMVVIASAIPIRLLTISNWI